MGQDCVEISGDFFMQTLGRIPLRLKSVFIAISILGIGAAGCGSPAEHSSQSTQMDLVEKPPTQAQDEFVVDYTATIGPRTRHGDAFGFGPMQHADLDALAKDALIYYAAARRRLGDAWLARGDAASELHPQ